MTHPLLELVDKHVQEVQEKLAEGEQSVNHGEISPARFWSLAASISRYIEFAAILAEIRQQVEALVLDKKNHDTKE